MGPAKRNLLVLVMVPTIFTIALAAPVSAQCAMCRSLLATPEGQKLVGGFRSGILLLLAAPFLAFGAVAVLAVRAQRRATPEHESDVDEGAGGP
jgi:hypothetical protein